MIKIFGRLLLIAAFFMGCNTVDPADGVPADTPDSIHSVEDSAREIINRANDRFHNGIDSTDNNNRNK